MERPKDVPASASWCDIHRGWEEGTRRGNLHEGPFRGWTEKGRPWWTAAFDAEGKVHGVTKRHLADGRVERTGEFHHGVRRGVWSFGIGAESDKETDYLVYVGAPPEIRSYTIDFRDGEPLGLQGMRFFDAEGAELDRWGSRIGSTLPGTLPPAPAGLREKLNLTPEKLNAKLLEAAGDRGPVYPRVLPFVPRAMIVRDLLTLGAAPGYAGYANKTALHYAAEVGGAGSVKVLLDAGAPVGARDREGRTPLLMTPSSALLPAGDRLPIIEMLLRAGASLDEKDEKGRTLFDLACWERSLDIVRLLLEKKVPLTGRKTPPLHIAAFTESEELTALLLEAGADPNERGSSKETALQVAKRQGQATILQLLKKAGATPPPRADVAGGDVKKKGVLSTLKRLKKPICDHPFFEKEDFRSLQEACEAYFEDKSVGSSEELVNAVWTGRPPWVSHGLLRILEKSTSAKAAARTVDAGAALPKFHRGNLTVEGDVHVVGPLLVTGSLIVRGILRDGGPDSILIVGGDLRARAFYTDGEVIVGGDVIVDEIVYGFYNDQSLRVEGGVRAKALIEDDHEVEILGSTKVKHRFERDGFDASAASVKKVFVDDVFDDEGLDRKKLFERLAAGKPVFR